VAPLIKVIDEKPVAKIGDKILIMADVGRGVFLHPAGSDRAVRPCPPQTEAAGMSASP
jgi:hypothetical protein